MWNTTKLMKGCDFMIYVGIDVAKEKHDCFIVSSDGEIIRDVFTFKNNLEGFNSLLASLADIPKDEIIVGLEATGHYSMNIMRFITDNQLPLVVLNPLQTNLFRKAQTLRKSKTDKIDARLIALMLHSGNFKPHLNLSYHLKELKSLTRHKSRIKENLTRDNTFKAYYQKKKAEGKHHYVANSHVAKKLIRVIYFLLSKNIDFVAQS